MADLGSIPNWITAFIAGGALFAAYKSIRSQREIARKRAATDFFLKTEMDRETLQSHKDYTAAVQQLKKSVVDGKMDISFANSKEYWHIRDYLNLHELMSVGLKNDVFDDNVCFDFWSGELMRAYQDTLPLIKYVQGLPFSKGIYFELEKIAKRWEAKPNVY